MAQGFDRRHNNNHTLSSIAAHALGTKKGSRMNFNKGLKKGARVIKPRRSAAIVEATRKKLLTSKHIKQSEEMTGSLLSGNGRSATKSKASK